jgi:hypothetical protein
VVLNPLNVAINEKKGLVDEKSIINRPSALYIVFFWWLLERTKTLETKYWVKYVGITL